MVVGCRNKPRPRTHPVSVLPRMCGGTTPPLRKDATLGCGAWVVGEATANGSPRGSHRMPPSQLEALPPFSGKLFAPASPWGAWPGTNW